MENCSHILLAFSIRKTKTTRTITLEIVSPKTKFFSSDLRINIGLNEFGDDIETYLT